MQFKIIAKTILLIPIAVLAHLFGSIVVLILIPNTVYDLIVSAEKKRVPNGNL